MTTKILVYNLSLGHLGERKTTLTENREPRRVLDDYWDQVVSECIAEGYWKWAKRVVQIDNSGSVSPAFGWSYAFTIPDDWVRTYVVSTVDTLNPPLLDYAEEAGFWYANSTPLFASYISDDPQYGNNIGAWPANFTSYVAFKLAEYSCKRITGTDEPLKGPDGIIRRCYKAKIKAKSTDAMNDPPGQLPTGTWALSRRGFTRGLPMPGGDMFDD